MILITGASGMLGGYVREQFSGEKIATLGRSEGDTYRCDLTKGVPDFGNERFDLVVHCAGTELDFDARSLNFDGTRRLLQALEENPPKYFVYVSSCKVYSPEGENLDEESNLWASGEAGESKASAETEVKRWAGNKGTVLTIIRPAIMFGKGVGGDTLRLFNDALSGWYVHIRGNNARVSLVSALDVAKGIKMVYKEGGVYNAADGVNPRFIDMVEAMTANAGAMKRMTHLPASWAEWVWRLGRWIPAIDSNLNHKVAGQRMKTLTINGERLAEHGGFNYFDTLEVISRTSKDYPYED